MNKARCVCLGLFVASCAFSASNQIADTNTANTNKSATKTNEKVREELGVKEPPKPRDELLKLTVAMFGGGIVAAILGAGLSAAASNWLAVRREEKRDMAQRKREFRGYLAELESRIERLPDDIRGDLGDNKIWNGYLEVIHQFHRERGKVICDFLPHDEFNRLCDAFGRLGHKAVAGDPEKRHPRNVLAEAVKALVKFTGERLA